MEPLSNGEAHDAQACHTAILNRSTANGKSFRNRPARPGGAGATGWYGKPNYDVMAPVRMTVAGRFGILSCAPAEDVIVSLQPVSPFKAKLLKDAEERFSYELGNAALAQGKLNEAAELYSRALQVKPDNALALGNLARVLDMSGDAAQAEKLREAADATGIDWRADAEYDLGRCYEIQGKTEQAAAAFDRTLSLNPLHLDALVGRLAESIKAQDYFRTLEIYESIRKVDLSPLSRSQRLLIGVRLSDYGRTNDALEIFDLVLADTPNDLHTLIYRCVALHNAGRYGEALAVADHVVDLNASESWTLAANTERARALIAMGRAADAAALLGELRLRYPKDFWIHTRSAQALGALGRQEEALELFEAAVPLFETFGWGHINLGVAFEAAGQAEQALKCYRQAVAMDPKEAWGYIYLGSALEAAGAADASATYREGLQKGVLIGRALYATSDASEARRRLAGAQAKTSTAASPR